MNDLMNNILKGALSIFLIVLALSIFIFAMPDTKDKDYAYVNYDGGYTALGYIAGIEYQFNVTVEDDYGEIYADGKSEVIELLNSLDEGALISKGVFLKFNNAFEYQGSVQDFTLTINTDKHYSDGEVLPSAWERRINSTESLEKNNFKKNALSYLDFESAPGGSNPLAFIKNMFD